MRIDVLSIASPGKAYDAMKLATTEHLSCAPPGLRWEFVYGDSVSSAPTDLDTHYDEVPECLIPGILDKSLAAMRSALDSGSPPDYIIRTNASTWFHWDRLETFLRTAARTGLAAGYSPDHSHLCGCCIVLSADVARALVDFPEYDRTLIDDLALSQALAHLDVKAQFIPRIDILSDGIVGHGAEVGLNPADAFQFRVKMCLGGDDDARQRDARIIDNVSRAYRDGTRDTHELLHAGMAGIVKLARTS